MVVTELVEINRSRSKVYLDGEFAFVLYKGELRRYGIRTGEELKEEIYREILDTLLVKRAKVRSMSLLKDRPYTERQLRDKLQQGGYPESVSDLAVDYLKSYGYLNDLTYAEDYIEYHSSTRSRRRIEQDLAGKGVNREQIRQAFARWEELGGQMEEERQIRAWLQKKNYDIHTEDPKQKQKMMAFLYRKGFGAELIRKALNCEDFS